MPADALYAGRLDTAVAGGLVVAVAAVELAAAELFDAVAAAA